MTSTGIDAYRVPNFGELRTSTFLAAHHRAKSIDMDSVGQTCSLRVVVICASECGAWRTE